MLHISKAAKQTETADVLALLDAPTAKLVERGAARVAFLFQTPPYMKDRTAGDFADAMNKTRRSYAAVPLSPIGRFDGAALKVKYPKGMEAGTFVRAFGGVFQVWAAARGASVWAVDEHGATTIIDAKFTDFERLGGAEWTQDALLPA